MADNRGGPGRRRPARAGIAGAFRTWAGGCKLAWRRRGRQRCRLVHAKDAKGPVGGDARAATLVFGRLFSNIPLRGADGFLKGV